MWFLVFFGEMEANVVPSASNFHPILFIKLQWAFFSIINGVGYKYGFIKWNRLNIFLRRIPHSSCGRLGLYVPLQLLYATQFLLSGSWPEKVDLAF